jgi:RHS repeat-associated protein
VEFVVNRVRDHESTGVRQLGNLISETDSSVEVSFGFTGKWTDPETGYAHHLNRWFDPVIGKWLSEDPIGFDGGDTNLQRYVANQVTSMIDTDGLDMGIGQQIETTGGARSIQTYRDLFGDPAFGIQVGDSTEKTVHSPDSARGRSI